jgi:DHA2 family multidrug resistance protein-like MFS transporter
MSLGFGFTFTLTADLVVGTAPPERAGAASAISETGAEFGGALGIAVLGSIGMAIYRNHIADSLPPGIPAEAMDAARETLGGAVTVASGLSDQLGLALLDSARLAFIQGLHMVATIGMIGFASLAVLTVILLRHVEIHGGEESEPESEPLEQTAIPRRQPEVQIGD